MQIENLKRFYVEWCQKKKVDIYFPAEHLWVLSLARYCSFAVEWLLALLLMDMHNL